MFERVIWEIEGVKFTKKSGNVIIPNASPQYQNVKFVSEYLDNIKFPYKIITDKIDKNTLMYRFVVDEVNDKQVSTEDIYAVQDVLKTTLRLLNWSIDYLQTH